MVKCSSIVFTILLSISLGSVGYTKFIANAQSEPDDNGVLITNYHGVQRKVYNPLVTATGGLAYYQDYKNYIDTEKSREYFIATADWFVENSVNRTINEKTSQDEYVIWEYGFPWKFYGWIEPPYYSALAQAEAIYLLALAYDLTNDEKYSLTANKALKAYLIDYDMGGLSTIDKDDGNSAFLHLVAKPEFKKIYVLNGHTQSLIFLWQYYELTGDPTAKLVFDRGINYLKENLWRYDTGSWSLYDLMENLATKGYHEAQISQLQQLYDITGEPILKAYADTFNKYLKSQPLEE
jgi:heparosan-N-sulfate-glucuronate 5-epimerase